MIITAANSGSNANRARASRSLLAVVVGAVVLLGACSGENLPADATRPDEPLVTLPGGSEPAEPAPEPTEAPSPEPTEAPAPEPTEAPSPEEPSTTEPVEDDTTTEETILIILLIVALLGLIMGLVAWLSRRSKGSAPAAVDLRPQLVSISTRSRWIVDQGVPTLLSTTEPAALQATWATMSSNLTALQSELTSVSGRVAVEATAALTELGTSVAGMRGALEHGYQTRLQHAGEPEMLAPSDQAILAQSDQLRRSIQAFEYATA